MNRNGMSLKDYAIAQTKKAGVLPCIKLHEKGDWIKIGRAHV